MFRPLVPRGRAGHGGAFSPDRRGSSPIPRCPAANRKTGKATRRQGDKSVSHGVAGEFSRTVGEALRIQGERGELHGKKSRRRLGFAPGCLFIHHRCRDRYPSSVPLGGTRGPEYPSMAGGRLPGRRHGSCRGAVGGLDRWDRPGGRRCRAGGSTAFCRGVPGGMAGRPSRKGGMGIGGKT